MQFGLTDSPFRPPGRTPEELRGTVELRLVARRVVPGGADATRRMQPDVTTSGMKIKASGIHGLFGGQLMNYIGYWSTRGGCFIMVLLLLKMNVYDIL